jgi:hypothetical protein
MEQLRERNGDEVWRSSSGELRMSSPVPGIIVTRFHGDLAADFAAPMIAAMHRAASAGQRITVFADLERAHNYHTSARLQLTQGVLQLRSKIDALHFIVSSRILALGVQAANVALGNLVLHDDRVAFERALSLALSNARRPRSASV